MEKKEDLISPYLFPGIDLSKLDKTKHNCLKNVISFTEEDVIDIVAQEFNVTKDSILSKSRKRIYVEPRQVISYILKTKYKITLSTIGEFVGGRDHTSIIHYLDVFPIIYKTDKRYRNKCKNILINVGLDHEDI
jgi:chromosomal replication initiation ATPase DnaA